MVSDYAISIRRACKMMGVARSDYYYRSCKDDSALLAALGAVADKYPCYGFRKLYACLKRQGHVWNHKKVYRVYKLLSLNKRRKGRRRLPSRVKQPLQQPLQINQNWSMDFMSDSLANGRKFRTLNIIDDCNREALAIEIDTSICAKRVIRTLEQIILWRGKPACIRVDNGPEFTSKYFEHWCIDKAVQIKYTQPGRPMQNGYIERFNGSYRKELLDAYLFTDLDEVKALTEEWMQHYNTQRPHEALNNRTPWECLNEVSFVEKSNLELSE